LSADYIPQTIKEYTMLVKNFINPVDSIEDITNIPERRRFVIIYKYSGPHRTLYEMYQGGMYQGGVNNTYDLYVINSSTLVGKDYIIPKGTVVQYKNTYRGKITNPFNPDGSLNMAGFCIFNSSSFATRIVTGPELYKFSKKDVLRDGTYENYIANLLKCDTITPFPNYYNVEDQAHLAKADYQKMDFELFLNRVPEYTLNDLRDSKTTFVALSINDENNIFRNENDFSRIIEAGNPYTDYNQSVINTVRDQIINAFLTCYDEVNDSLFSQVYIIIDIESGLMNIPVNGLTLKHSYNITKEEINSEYLMLLEKVDEVVENLYETFSTDYINDIVIPIGRIPERMEFYISPTLCKINITSAYKNKDNNSIKAMAEYSTSDAEESSLCREVGEFMYPSDYDYIEDEPF
jgi:hypothetical protein